MMNLSEKQRQNLIQREQRGLERITDVTEMFKNPRKSYNWAAIVSSVGRTHEAFAVKHYFIDHDISSFKQHAYVYIIAELIALNKGHGDDELDTDLILLALLSDSSAAIQGVGLAAPRFIRAGGNQPQSQYFWLHMYQLVMLDQMNEVAQRLEKAKTQVKKNQRKELSEGKDFFSLLLVGDKTGLEKLLLEKAQNDATSNPWLESLVCIRATIEAKLCWLKGIEVQIDHPLVPMELLPIKPLDHYDDVYDFLSPDWVPPPQNVFEKITKWIKG